MKIQTYSGKKYLLDKYSFTDKFIVSARKDTIFFDDIKWIRGKVQDDEFRKITGILLTTLSIGIGVPTLLAVIETGGPVLIMTIIVGGAIYEGFHLAGSRKFWKANGCFVLPVKQEQKALK